MIDVIPTGHFSAPVSLALASILCLAYAALLFHAARAALRHQREGRAADAIDKPGAQLAVGATVVAGLVELDEGVPFAARVEIKQVGKEKRGSKGSVQHTWRESDRQVFVHPFWIRHASGERVFVRPTKNVRLVDSLDKNVHDEAQTRYLIAELSDGETVVAEGVLRQERVGKPTGQGYRDGVELNWTLTPGPLGRLHLSAEKFGQKHRRKASSLLKLVALGWLPCAIVTALCVYPFFVRTFSGTPVDAVVTDLRHETSRNSEQQIQHVWRVEYSGEHGRGRELLTNADWAALDIGDSVTLVHVDGYDDVLGQEATLYFWWLLIPALLLALIFILIVASNKEEWFDAAVVEHGSGRLAPPVPSEQAVLSRSQVAAPPIPDAPVLPE